MTTGNNELAYTGVTWSHNFLTVSVPRTNVTAKFPKNRGEIKTLLLWLHTQSLLPSGETLRARLPAEVLRRLRSQSLKLQAILLPPMNGDEYGSRLLRRLLDEKIDFTLVLPETVTQFARIHFRRSLADPIDATLLGQFGESERPETTHPPYKAFDLSFYDNNGFRGKATPEQLWFVKTPLLETISDARLVKEIPGLLEFIPSSDQDLAAAARMSLLALAGKPEVVAYLRSGLGHHSTEARELCMQLLKQVEGKNLDRQIEDKEAPPDKMRIPSDKSLADNGHFIPRIAIHAALKRRSASAFSSLDRELPGQPENAYYRKEDIEIAIKDMESIPTPSQQENPKEQLFHQGARLSEIPWHLAMLAFRRLNENPTPAELEDLGRWGSLDSYAGSSRARLYFRAGLNHPFPEARQYCIEALTIQGDKQSIPKLREMAEKEADLNARLAAITALAEFNDRKATPVLVSCLSSDTALVREAAANALAAVGRGSESAISALGRLLETEQEEDVREAAQATLEILEKPQVAHTRTLSWEVLPPGWWNDVIVVNRLLSGVSTRRQKELIHERLKYVDSLGPQERYEGLQEFGNRRYVVFVFASQVIAECPLWGNALYAIEGTQDWQEVLKLTKRELLLHHGDRVARVIHSGDWMSHLRSLVL